MRQNSSRIDKAFETLFNIPFYALVATMILIQLDPLALFLSSSSVILAFAFMIGRQCAKYRGLLYSTGDRMALEIEFMSVMETDTNFTGSGMGKPCFGSFGSGKTNCILTLPSVVASLRLSKISRYSRRLLFGDQRRDAVHRTAPWPTVASSTARSPQALDLSQNTRHALRKDSYFQDCNRRVFESASRNGSL
jgi:hypothetical protein